MIVVAMMFVLALIGYFATLNYLIDQGYTNWDLFIAALNLIAIAVPAYLPICLSIGTIYSLQRLKN